MLPTVNYFHLLAATIFLGLPSCDKVQTLAAKLGKETAAAPAEAAKPYTGEVVSEITEAGFDQLRQKSGRVIVFDFYADWCGPCRRLSPILHEIATEKQGLVLVGKVNVDNSPELATRHGVQGIPDVRIFRDGKEVDRFVGLPGAAEVRRRIEAQLKGLPPLPAEPEKPKSAGAVTQPMDKDWLPPVKGMQRR